MIREGNEPREVDLHTHSTASDGAAAPRAVVEAAIAARLSCVALTDHDSIDGVGEALAAGASSGIRVVAGCELSAHDGDEEVHLLALHIRDTDAIAPSLRSFRDGRVDRAAAMVKLLNTMGVPVTFEQVVVAAGGGAVGRPHVARVLIAGGFVADHREAFDRYLAAGRPAYVPKPRLELRDAIGIAHSAGALAVWAHPGRGGNLARVERFAALGLDGIEVRHPGHSPGDVASLERIATTLDLVPSGGSDWHGATDGYRTLGNMHVPDSWLEMQDARLAARAA